MRIVVASCWKYRDAHMPFLSLLRKFWPACPYPAVLLTDNCEGPTVKAYDSTYLTNGSWGEMLAEIANKLGDQPILLMQEDFFISAPVNELFIKKGVEQLQERNAAMVRIYPCPGGDIPYGDKLYAEISKGTRYRVSCQASIWRPDVLHKIASQCETPFDFEMTGSKISNDLKEPFLAFRRDVQPWPISYICSAISRGKWEPAALEFCKANGIDVDTSMREVALS